MPHPLALTLLVVLPFAERIEQAKQQRHAVEALRDAGFWVRYDYQEPVDKGLVKEASPPAPPWLTELLGIDFFSDVCAVGCFGGQDFLGYLHGTPKSWDNDLKHLQMLRGLRWLGLGNLNVTNDGIQHLKRLQNVETIVLSGTRVTEEGIKELREALPYCRIR